MIVVPTAPESSPSRSDRRPITAGCPLRRTKSQAAVTFGPMEPAAKSIADISSTLIVEMAALRPVGTRLTGPGIREAAALSLPEGAAFRANAALAPQGLDFFFTCGARLAAVPRSTRVEDC